MDVRALSYGKSHTCGCSGVCYHSLSLDIFPVFVVVKFGAGGEVGEEEDEEGGRSGEGERLRSHLRGRGEWEAQEAGVREAQSQTGMIIPVDSLNAAFLCAESGLGV